MAKPDYYGGAGQRRKCRVLESLRGSGDLGSESEAIAERWMADYQYARFGYADFMREPLPDSYIKGDAITFGLGRAKGGQRIAMIREALGAEAHDFLVRLLIDEHAFTEIARDMVPHIKGTAGGKAVRQRAVMLLQILPRFYRAALLAQKKEAQKKEVQDLAGMTGSQKA